MAKQDTAEVDQAAQQQANQPATNSDGIPIEVTGRASNRGRKPGQQAAPRTLTVDKVRSFTAEDLGLTAEDAQGMARKNTAGGRPAGERSEQQQAVDYDVYEAYQAYLQSEFASLPDTPGNRLVKFMPVFNVPPAETWPEREVTHDDGSKSTVREWAELKEAGRYLTEARDYLRKQGYRINLHVFAPRPHTDGSTWLIPWSVATRPEPKAKS